MGQRDRREIVRANVVDGLMTLRSHYRSCQWCKRHGCKRKDSLVSLTSGSGPLSKNAAGRLNFELPDYVLYVEPLGRRVRAIKQGQTVVDSDDALMVYETGKSARYLLPARDVQIPAEPFPNVDDHVTVAWSEADAWFEEDERIFGHPINPYHRIDTFRTSRRIEVSVNGVSLASSTRAKALHENGLAVRYYLPPADVNRALLIPSRTVTECRVQGRRTLLVGEYQWSRDRRHCMDVREQRS